MQSDHGAARRIGERRPAGAVALQKAVGPAHAHYPPAAPLSHHPPSSKTTKQNSTLLAAALAAASVAAAQAADIPKLNLMEDPLDISNDLPSDYRNWASVMGRVLLKKEGSEDAAIDALGRVMLAAHGHLAKVANGEDIFPRLHLADPVFAADAHGFGHELESIVSQVAGKVKGAKPKTDVVKFAASSAFMNFAPCVLSETPVS